MSPGRPLESLERSEPKVYCMLYSACCSRVVVKCSFVFWADRSKRLLQGPAILLFISRMFHTRSQVTTDHGHGVPNRSFGGFRPRIDSRPCPTRTCLDSSITRGSSGSSIVTSCNGCSSNLTTGKLQPTTPEQEPKQHQHQHQQCIQQQVTQQHARAVDSRPAGISRRAAATAAAGALLAGIPLPAHALRTVRATGGFVNNFLQATYAEADSLQELVAAQQGMHHGQLATWLLCNVQIPGCLSGLASSSALNGSMHIGAGLCTQPMAASGTAVVAPPAGQAG